MSCNNCGADLPPGTLICPRCHTTAFSGPRVAPTAPDTNRRSHPSATSICPRPWCAQPYSAGALVCPACGEPVPDLIDEPTQTQRPPPIYGALIRLADRTEILVRHGSDLVIGRESEDQTLAERLDAFEGVSRRHAHLSVTDTGVTLADLQSTNGTQLNNRPVRAPEQLAPGTHQVRLGRDALFDVEVVVEHRR